MATSFGVDLIFKAHGVNKLKGFTGETSKLDAAARKAQGSLNRASNSITKTGRSAQGATGKVKGLTKSFSTLKAGIATLGLGLFIKGMFSAAASIEQTKLQLKTLVGSAEAAERVYRDLQKINKQSPFQIKDLTKASTRLSAYGVKTENLTKVTRQLGLVAAGTGQDIDGIATAYGQVVAKGRLQGEELMQFMERGVDVSGELQRMLGLTKEEFADMTSKGQISAELVQIAIANMTGETGRFNKAFENTADSLNTKLSNMQDAFFNTAGALGKAFEPVFKYLIDEATKFLNLFTNVLGNWQKESSLGNSRVQELKLKAAKAADDKYGVFTLGKEKENFRNSTFRNYVEAEVASRNKPSAASQLKAGTAPTPGTYTPAQTNEWRQLLGEQKKANDKGTRQVSASKQLMGTVVEVLTGDKSSQFYRADHGGQNYHVHVAFETQEQKELAKALLQSKGIQIGSENDGKHAPGSYHYSNQAFDVPMSQVPVGQEDALSQKILGILGKQFGGLLGGTGGGGNVVGQLFADARVELDRLRESAVQTWQSMQQGILGTNTNLEAQVNDLNEVNRLIMEGNDPAIAQERVSAERALSDIRTEQVSKLAELNKLQGLTTDELKSKEAEINALYKERLGLQQGLNSGRKTATELATADTDNSQAQSDASGLASTISGGLKQAIVTAMQGGDVGQVFAQLAQNIGQKFLDIALRPFEQALEQAFMGAFNPQKLATDANTIALQQNTLALNTAAAAGGGGGFGGGIGGFLQGALGGGLGVASPGGFDLGGLGGLFTPGGSIPFFADGGYVSGPTTAVIGEAGDEYVIPSARMGSAMNRYAMGARGGAVLDGAEGAAAGGAGGGGVIKFESTVINGIEFVTRDEAEAIGHRAANDGAKRGAEGGKAKTLGTLRNSRSQRSRLGL